MDGGYQAYLASMAGVRGQSSPHPQQIHLQRQQQPPLGMPMGSSAFMQSSYPSSLGPFTGFPEPIMYNSVPKAQRSRRRSSAPGLDHIKHRRTRSGCYTCRSRRVKVRERLSRFP
jgi:hypothetical protein